jgi:hypothetical protein
MSEWDVVLGVPSEGIVHESEIPCTREDEALAVAFGYWLCGAQPRVFMQNSGWGNSLDCITSLWMPYAEFSEEGSMDLVVSNRTDPEHHMYMGTFFINYHKRLQDVFNAVRSHCDNNEKCQG